MRASRLFPALTLATISVRAFSTSSRMKALESAPLRRRTETKLSRSWEEKSVQHTGDSSYLSQVVAAL